jgi:iron-sulfur cluster assembly accessory protein
MISLTEAAAQKVKTLAAEEPGSVLRLAVEGGGCSGFQYAIGFDSGSDPDDLTLESHGVRLVVDPVSLPYLEGSVVDYKDGLIGAGFSFDNPNVAATCGCNSSFQAKDGIEGPYSPKPGNGCS